MDARELCACRARRKKIGATLSSMIEFDEKQLGAARAAAWRQAGDPLLTLEAARDWINERGLVLFAPRSQQLPVPAPSLVEATLGAPNATPTMSQTEIARGLVARLAGEGLALPLNLMGVPGDAPDFVVSAQVFSYVFTMRGDKAWKLPPSTSGAVKVSPLGLRVFEVLTERGPMSAAELAQELGREVTETAILRSLSELWSQLRVLPLLSQGDGSTLWELTSRRFTKAIKAGANAGQPTALSALISLYLAQVFLATEEDVMTFLSPLTARSRVRDVLHALMGARQLDTLVLDGKTLLHIPGTLAAAAGPSAEEAATGDISINGAAARSGGDADKDASKPVAERPKKIGTGRIKSFKSEERTAGEFRGKPAAHAFTRGRSGSMRAGAGPVKPSARFGARLDKKTEPERRPFKRANAGAEGSAEKRTFSKPWNEERRSRPSPGDTPASMPDGFTKFRRPAPEDRKPLGPREQAGLPEGRRSAPKSSFDRAGKPGGFAKKPYAPRSTDSAERGTFQPRSYERTGGRPNRPAGEGRDGRLGGFGAKRSYTQRSDDSAGDRPMGKRPYTPSAAEGGERKTYKPRSYESRDRGAKPAGRAAPRPYPVRNRAADAAPHAEAGSVERTLPKRPYKPRAADAHERPFTKAPWVPKDEGDGGKRPSKARGASGFSRGGAGGGKRFGDKPGKGFGGRPARKFDGKPGGRSAGGVRPTFRKKPETER